MITTPSSFTYEYLSSLKFKELQKLSVQFKVNKRWAKKHELIENLLALKEKNEPIENKKEDEQEWRDASTVFSDLKLINENEGNKRLTYNVTSKSNIDHHDPHLTFEVPQNGKNLLSESVNSRETYDLPPRKGDFILEPLLEPRATFEIPQEKRLLDEAYSRAAFDIYANEEKLLEEDMLTENKNSNKGNTIKKNFKNLGLNNKEGRSSELKQDLRKMKFDTNSRNEKQKKDELQKQEVKMLTIPYTRVSRRTKKDETSKNDSLPIKISKKSINIKKSTRIPVSKIDLIKSPAFSSVKKSVNKQVIIQSLSKDQPEKIIQSKVPIRLQFTEKKNQPTDNEDKENVKKIHRKRILKTADETFYKKTNPAKVNFRTPPTSEIKSSRVLPSKKDSEGKLNSITVQTPGNKPLTTTKMPDFSKIHKRQFEQMDSLHDYIKKKEERIRKLFGTPQPGQQLHNLNKSASVFHFQSIKNEKEKGRESFKNVKTPSKKKENDSKLPQKEVLKSKLPPAKLWTDIKDKNRSHIHGVRTNKRFELQMKFRNI